MELQFIDYGSDAYLAAANLRYRLFYQPHGLDEAITLMADDAQDSHLVVQQDGQVLAYGRLVQTAHQFTIHQMVVEPAWQRQGLGKLVLQTLVDRARQRSGRSVSLNARVTQLDFYKRQGFKTIGDVFASAATGVAHIKMEKLLEQDV